MQGQPTVWATHTRRAHTILRRRWAALAPCIAALSCRPPPYRAVALAPSLTPLDVTRPHVLYPHAQGRHCGPESLQRALQDLRRVRADGFVEVVVVEEGDAPATRCTTVTARPFTYCRRHGQLAIDADPQVGAGVTVVPAREGACQEEAAPCRVDCVRFAEAAGVGEALRDVLREECLGRCTDAAFQQCARSASTRADVERCRAMAPQEGTR